MAHRARATRLDRKRRPVSPPLGPRPADVRSWLRREGPALLPVAAAAILVYANALHGPFVYDDLRQIVRNPFVQDSSQFWRALSSDVWAFKAGGSVAVSNYWRPTFMLWLIANVRLFGLSPVGWHAANVLLHAVVAALAYGLMRRLTLPAGLASPLALVFAVHPVHVETVAWISGSPDLLLSAALLGSLFAMLVYARGGPAPYRWIAVGLYAIALGAKESAILFPVIVIVALRWPPEAAPRPWARAARDTLPFVAAAAGYFLLRLAVLGQFSRPAEEGVSLGSALLSAPEAIAFYLRQIVWPWPIGPSYPLRPVNPGTPGLRDTLMPAVFVLAVAALAAWAARQRPAARLGVAFGILLLPALNISAFPAEQMVHDRYLYLSMLGALIVIGAAIEPVVRRQPRLAPLVSAVLVAASAALAVDTVFYNRAWMSELALWERGVASDSGSSFNHSQLAAALIDDKRYDEAIREADRALMIRSLPLARLNRGRALIETGRYAEADADLRDITDGSGDPSVNAYVVYQGYEALALSEERQGRLDLAAATLVRARERLPLYQAAITEKLAIVLYEAGRKADALGELERMRQAARTETLPESRAVLLRLGMLYAELGRTGESRTALIDYLNLTAPLGDENTLADRAEAIALRSRLPQ